MESSKTAQQIGGSSEGACIAGAGGAAGAGGIGTGAAAAGLAGLAFTAAGIVLARSFFVAIRREYSSGGGASPPAASWTPCARRDRVPRFAADGRRGEMAEWSKAPLC